MSNIKFTKMNGLGNDFIILDYDEYEKTGLSPDSLALKLCDRHFNIGADGLIIVNKDTKVSDISWIFYNSDGSIAEMCGNGIRCFARYVYDKGIVNKKEFTVETKAGVKVVNIVSDNEVRVNMGSPEINPEKIPFKGEDNTAIYKTSDGNTFNIYAISMGNPHCIIYVNEKSKDYAYKYGSEIENSNMFPNKTNVEFVEIVSRDEVILNVWERACGITFACGTGSCATVVAGVLNGLLNNSVKVRLPGGDLHIEWDGNSNDMGKDVFMTGKTSYSFVGEVEV